MTEVGSGKTLLNVLIYARAALVRARHELALVGGSAAVTGAAFKDIEYAIETLDENLAKLKPKAVHVPGTQVLRKKQQT